MKINVQTRRKELLLLLITVSITIIGFVSVEFAAGEPDNFTVGTSMLRIPAMFAALLLLTHAALCILTPRADQLIFPTVAFLNGLGLVVIHRLDLSLGRELAERQIIWTALGLIVCVATLVVLRDYRILTRFSYLLGALGLVLLAVPLVSPQPVESDARIWLMIGPFSIQPGEIAKVLLIAFFAMLISQKRALFSVAEHRFLGIGFPRLRDLAPIAVIGAIALVIMALTNDFGPALLLFLTVFGMVYVATSRTSWLLIGTAILLAGGTALAQFSSKIQQRISNMRDPLADFYNAGNQLSESLFGLSTGGITGSGLGQGYPHTIPLAFSDFILAAIGEELGLIGLAGVLIVFALLQCRIFVTALYTRESYGKLLVTGFGIILMVQVFVVTGGISGLIPMTGLTTPFMSAGGSSLLANYLIIALVLRVSHNSNQAENAHPKTTAATPGSLT